MSTSVMKVLAGVMEQTERWLIEISGALELLEKVDHDNRVLAIVGALRAASAAIRDARSIADGRTL